MAAVTGLALTRSLGCAACAGILLLAGCATPPGPLPVALLAKACLKESRELEALALSHDLHVSEPRAVDAVPSLASNRVLASFQPASLNEVQRRDWLQRLVAAGRERRQLLRGAFAAQAGSQSAPGAAGPGRPSDCAAAQADATAMTDRDWASLSAAVAIDDEYLATRRVLGLYPLSALPVKLGVNALQADIQSSFDRPLEDLPVRGVLQRYALDPLLKHPRVTAAGVQSRPALPTDSLGVKLFGTDRSLLDGVFAEHAPVLEIDVDGVFDRPGQPFNDGRNAPGVRSDTPLAYRYASLMPFAGRLRLQLNYVFWFDERPPLGPLDTLAGALDSLVWRVTLDGDGSVLLYDSIHSCGCYQQFFPSRRLAIRPAAKSWPEPPLSPQRAPQVAADEQLVLRISSGEHFLQRVYAEQSQASRGLSTRAYGLRSYEELYRPPASGRVESGRDSQDGPGKERGPGGLFNRYGLIPGTQRGERFYLWPMGIRSPGGMRERGRQPTAFLGRRHFDDADLLDSIFMLSP